MRELSILIPARNEQWLSKTVEDILAAIEADTEVIVVLDGAWADPAVPQHDRVNVVYLPESIGQRAATNLACRLSRAKYVMKVDAHCSFDKGFDRKMIESMEEGVTMVPVMRNLHVYDWVCACGVRSYQDKGSKCPACGKKMEMEVCWHAKRRPESASFCFDPTPHFQYFNEWTKRPGWGGDIVESMSIQGSCFMIARNRYWELNICDEALGSWGSQGIEVACKTWLSGGRVVINRKTWYAHCFRTKPQFGFGFPYPQSERKIQAAKAAVRGLFFDGKWQGASRPLSWLVERFWPVSGWTEADLTALKKSERLLK